MENKKQSENTFESAKEYFEILKSKKQKIDSTELSKIYDNCLTLLNKYHITGQTDAINKLLFHIETIEREKEVLSAGIDTFVYLSDIKMYIEKVPGRVVKVIELRRYEREIPDEVIESIQMVKHLFSDMFVVFTDYTKDHEKKHKKETDPILFGMFKDQESESVVERMYYIGDWEDEYCDLTFDKLITEMKSCTKSNIEHKIKHPKDIEELKGQLRELKKNDNNNSRERFLFSSESKKHFIDHVKTFFNRKK